MNYWLMKSEPFKYSFQQLQHDQRTVWDGVRNHLAAKNLRAMKKGDVGFFYHSNEGLAIVGTMAIVREAFADPSDETGKFVAVEVKPLQAAKTPLTLAAIKADALLQQMQMIRQSRLSVSAVSAAEAKKIMKLLGL